MHAAVKFAVLLLVLATGLRLAALMDQPARPTSLDLVRDQVALSWSPSSGQGSSLGELDSLRSLGVTRVVLEQFDPQALLVMRPGRDQQPGVAGVDDNANGAVDDRSELGATQSDDVCLVLPRSQTDLAREASTLVLQRGAFVPVTPDHSGSEPSQRGQRRRAIVSGQFGDDHWSFMLTAPSSAP